MVNGGYEAIMDLPHLERITITLPYDREFTDRLIILLGLLGKATSGRFEFTRSNPEYYPIVFLQSKPGFSKASATFFTSDGQNTLVKIENATGEEKQSPHQYGYVSLAEVARRLESAGLALTVLDHVGFNLPWFKSGVHPQIAALRSLLLKACLYHRFPTGEEWDFILPGKCDEIRALTPVNYSLVRRPKFELVSFEKASRPLVQIDVSAPAGYDTLARLFPESLKDPQIGNVWVYLSNGFTIDVCLVINPASDQDWSEFFKGYRL
jgi:hypothetical protein